MRYRYYEDLYNNQYRWSTQKSETDGKFVACLYKYKGTHDSGWFTLIKERRFNQRKTAKAWCFKNSRKATEHQRVVLRARENRKEQRIALKPVFTKEELKLQRYEDFVERLKKNIARADTKMKTLTTRKKTYEKKIKTTLRQIERMK